MCWIELRDFNPDVAFGCILKHADEDTGGGVVLMGIDIGTEQAEYEYS